MKKFISFILIITILLSLNSCTLALPKLEVRDDGYVVYDDELYELASFPIFVFYREHEMEEVARTKNMHGFYVPVSISKIDTDARYLYQSTDIIWKKIGSPELDVLTDVIDCFYLKRKHYSDTNDTRLLDFGAQTELTVSDIVTESLESVSIAERYYYIISFEDHPCLYADESVVKDADGNFYLGIYIDKGYDEVYLKVAPEYVPIFEDAVESLNAE